MFYTMKKTYLFCIAALTFLACSESFTDSRDGNTYDIVTIGSQTWFAENLKLQTNESFCPDGDKHNCNEFGLLYTWEAAQTACPEGWHLPSKAELETLLNSVGGADAAGAALKSTSGWFKKGNGSDAFDFAARPAGYMYRGGKFDGIGGYAHFWSASIDSEEAAFAQFLELDFSVRSAKIKAYDQGDARSIRCVKD